MKNDKIEDLFRNQDFDRKEPPAGHKTRFLKKLKEQNQGGKHAGSSIHLKKLWGSILSVAAIFVIAFMLFAGFFNHNFLGKQDDLAGVSPEMKETQQFYTRLIETELKTIQSKATPETEVLVKDALAQLKKLETGYEKLKKDLQKSGQDKRVIYAMISNFQKRIDLLTNVLNQIERIKSLKNNTDESYI